MRIFYENDSKGNKKSNGHRIPAQRRVENFQKEHDLWEFAAPHPFSVSAAPPFTLHSPYLSLKKSSFDVLPASKKNSLLAPRIKKKRQINEIIRVAKAETHPVLLPAPFRYSRSAAPLQSQTKKTTTFQMNECS
ncbi:MAG: hypothetical protein LBP50_05790 [Tannerella sp.]|jgi:hypothetical protein|nr:hypothetical protein [Tannerella sp.]